jgi:hypothetical protein
MAAIDRNNQNRGTRMIRMRIAGMGALLLAGACAGNPVRSIAAPAPADALSCSMRIMSGLGYTPIRGGVNDGYIVYERTYTEGLMGRHTRRGHVTATLAGDQLRVSTVGVDEKDKQMKASSETVGHAEAMISSCAHVQSGS